MLIGFKSNMNWSIIFERNENVVLVKRCWYKLQRFFWYQLENKDLDEVCSEQNSDTYHTARETITVIIEKFILETVVRGYLESKVYMNKLDSTAEIKSDAYYPNW